MLDLSNIKLTDEVIKEIDLADSFYRSIDLESFARINEDDLINNRTCLFSTILASSDIDKVNNIIRVSINRTINEDKTNNRLFCVDELKYPPKKVADKLYYNRASYKKQSMFYGGFGHFQALFENSPNTGDLFTISSWHQKEETTLHFAIIFHDDKLQNLTDMFRNEWNNYLNQLRKLDQKTQISISKLFSLITFFFTRPVIPSKRIEYLFSAFISNKIFEMSCSRKIEAILYPSVPIGYIASNIAILPEVFDSKFDFVKAEEFIVLNKIDGKNQWQYHPIAEATTLTNGKLNWVTSHLNNEVLNHMRLYKVDLDLIK
jgi:hypothetical protein